jgi:hypothetical protein
LQPSSCSWPAGTGPGSPPDSASWCSTRSTASWPAAPVNRPNGGNIFDHGVDLIHPPFWWWAWSEGLEVYGRPFERVYELLIVGAIVFGYVAQRVIEGIFVRRYRMHIHVWQQVDSRFRLITARRNPNMVILVVALAFGRPDLGIELVALWTLVSLIFHAVRLAQANARRDRGQPVTSWLA